jgi:hypothetical protein
MKNDPCVRHAVNTLEIASRSKHSSAESVLKNEPIRLFKFGASIGFVSPDRVLKKGSMVLGFTTMPFAERNFWDELGSHLAVGTDGVTVLADRFRILLRHLEFATKIFNQKGVALGYGAIEGAEIEEDSNRISFPDLSLSILFPENSDPHSRQALEVVTIMHMQMGRVDWPLQPTSYQMLP